MQLYALKFSPTGSNSSLNAVANSLGIASVLSGYSMAIAGASPPLNVAHRLTSGLGIQTICGP